jgi:hypothetical protein
MNTLLGFRIIATGCIIVVAAVVAYADARRWTWLHDKSWWILGEADPFRLLLFRENGELRKTGAMALYAVMIAAVWIF